MLFYLQYGLSQGEGFIVITGDIGTGKTTIVKNLLAGLDHKTYIAKELVTTHLEDHDLMEMICESFELISRGLTKAACTREQTSIFDVLVCCEVHIFVHYLGKYLEHFSVACFPLWV